MHGTPPLAQNVNQQRTIDKRQFRLLQALSAVNYRLRKGWKEEVGSCGDPQLPKANSEIKQLLFPQSVTDKDL